MDGKEIFDEVMKSHKLKEILGLTESDEVNETYDTQSQSKEITIIRNIIEGQIRHTSEDSIFTSIKRLYDL